MVQRAMESIVVAATPSAVDSVVADFGRSREWLDRRKGLRVAERDAGRALEVALRAASCGRSIQKDVGDDNGGAPEFLSWQRNAGDVTDRMNGCYFADASVPSDASTVTSEFDIDIDIAVGGAAVQVFRRAATPVHRQSLADLKCRVEALS